MDMLLKKALIDDALELRAVCVNSYSFYFTDYWEAGGLEWYLDEQFGDEKLQLYLGNPDIDFYFITVEGKSVGFIKVIHRPTSNLPFGNYSELEKIYILKEYKGMGIGKKAIAQVVRLVKDLGKSTLVLDVLDTNTGAIGFYENFGFIFHDKVRLDLPYFKDHLRGLNIMYYPIN